MSEITALILNEEPEEIIFKKIISILKNYKIDIDFINGSIVTTKKEPPCQK